MGNKVALPDHVNHAVHQLIAVIDGHVINKMMQQGMLDGLTTQAAPDVVPNHTDIQIAAALPAPKFDRQLT